MSNQNLNFNGKQLQGKSFRGQDLRGADFSGADIRGVNFSMANLENAIFDSVLAGIHPLYAAVLSETSTLLLFVFYACYALNFLFLPILVCMGQTSYELTYIISTILIADILPTLSLSSNEHDNLVSSLRYRVTTILLSSLFGFTGFISRDVVVILTGYLVSSLIIHSIGIFNIFVRVRIGTIDKPPAIVKTIHNIVELFQYLLLALVPIVVLACTLGMQFKFIEALSPLLTSNEKSLAPLWGLLSKTDINMIERISVAYRLSEKFPLWLALYVIFSILPLGALTNFFLWEQYRPSFSDENKYNIFRFPIPFRTDFHGANLINAAFHKAILIDTSFKKANLSGSNLSESLLRGTNFQQTNLSHVLWLKCRDIDKTISQGTILEDSDVCKFIISRDRKSIECKHTMGENKYRLCGKNLIGLDLIGLDLADVDFSDSNLSEALLRNAILTRANLARALLNRVDLSNADLSDADLSDCSVQGANIENAILTGAILDNWKGDKNTRLWNAKCSHITTRIKNPLGSYTERREMGRAQIESIFSNNTKIVSLLFQERINWKAFNYASHKFQLEKNCLVQVVNAEESSLGDKISSLVISIPDHVNESEFRREFNRSYGLACKSLAKTTSVDLGNVSKTIKDLMDNQVNDYRYIVKLLSSPRTVTYQVETMNSIIDNSRNVEIHGAISGSTINLGRISAEVKNTVNSFTMANDSATAALGDLLIQLQQAVEKDAHLPNEDKEDLLMQIIALANLPNAKNHERKHAVVRNARKIFTATLKNLPDTAKIVEACSKLLPLIFKALGF